MVDRLLLYFVFSSVEYGVNKIQVKGSGTYRLVSGKHVPALSMKYRLQESSWNSVLGDFEVQPSSPSICYGNMG